jgi:hypothetical protein
MVNSRKKGSRGELELSKELIKRGIPARRGRQYAGHEDAPDVLILGTHGSKWYAEVKRREVLPFYKIMAQARAEAGPDKWPVLFARNDGGKWTASVDLDVWCAMYRAWNLEEYAKVVVPK